MSIRTLSFTFAFTLAGSASVQAVPQTFVSSGGIAADQWIDGTGESMIVPLNIAVHGTINSISVGLPNFFHSWSGDLVIILHHVPTNTSLTLLDRPGVPESVFGNSDEMIGSYEFANGGMPFPDGEGSGKIIPSGAYAPAGPGDFSVFHGLDQFGAWELIFQDHAGEDIGFFANWELHIDATIPAPPAAALLLALAGARRRRN